MIKKLIWMWLICVLVTFIIFLEVSFWDCRVHGHDFDLLEKSIKAAIYSIFITSGPIVVAYSIIPRSKYLENNEIEKPSFKIFCTSVIDVSQEFDFSRLKSEIAQKWVITFSDDVAYVLKFRQKISFFKNSWAAAAWLKYDDSMGKIHLECFPMAGMQDNDIARKMQKEIVKYLKPPTNP